MAGGCSYDLSALRGNADDGSGAGGAIGSGGRFGATGGTIATGGLAGTGGRVGGTGGAIAGSGGLGSGGGGAAGGTTSTGGNSGGASAGGGSAGGRSAGGVGGAGAGAGTGGQGMPFALSVDFIGGRTLVVAAGGATGAGTGGAPMIITAPAMSASEVAGVKPVSQWNGASGPAGSLVALLGNGTVSTVNVTWNSPGSTTGLGVYTLAHADAPGSARMMNGYLDPVAAAMPATVVVSNLPAAVAASGYDVYVYASGFIETATTRTYRYTLGGASFTVSQTGPTATTWPGFTLAPTGGAGNYVIFRNVTGESFTLTATPGTGSPTRAPLNGIQIIAPSGS
ncbi:MAG: hypothetical protein ABUS79_00360 [Pseudomonadota bacterium]